MIEQGISPGLRRIREKTGQSTRVDLSLVLLLLALSGNMSIGRMMNIDAVLIVVAIFLLFLLRRQGKHLFTQNFFLVFSIFFFVLLVQCISFEFWPVVTILGFFTRLFIGYAVVRLVGNFPLLYVRAMVFLAKLSFVFHVPYLLMSYFGISLEGPITRVATMLGTETIKRRPILIHTFMGEFSPRNDG